MESGRLDFLGRFSISARLVFLFVVLLVAMVGSSLYLMRTLGQASQTTEDAQKVSDQLDIIAGVRAAFHDLRYWQTDLAVSLLNLAENNATDARARLDRELDRLKASMPTEAEALRQSYQRFDAVAKQAVDAYTDDQRVIGNTLFAQARQDGMDVDRILTDIEGDLRAKAQAARQGVLDEFSSGARFSMLMTIGAVLLGGFLTYIILSSILTPLHRLSAAIRGITRGDADVELPPPSRDELGKMTEALELLRDSYEERQKLAEEAGRQRSTLFDAIESINQGFALYDKDDRLQLVNSHYRQLQPGLGDHIAPGMTFADILRVAVKLGIHTDRPEEEWIAERLRHRGEETGRLELFAEGRWIQINERRTHDGGIVAVYTDVTELQLRQAQLETAKEEADRATQVKSEFLANMSHELRTPLNAIIGYSQILQEDATDAGNTDTIPDLQKIENAGNHLLHLINDILDLSKIEAGRMEVYVETFDIAGLVRDVQTLVQPLATNNRNQLVVDCPADIGQVSSDITKVKQALLNLLSNATKFTQDGTVTLKVQRTSGVAGHKLAFSVTDTGIGMSEQQMSRLFQAFSQADNSTTRRFGGTGLGLAISRSFARTLGGDLTVSSEPGKGSCFTLTLPAEAPKAKEEGTAEPAAAPAEAVPEHGSAPRVLVVDDDPSAGHIIGSHLAREGYSLLYAKSGPEAIEMARLHKPDAITLDIMMPQVDGWSVLVALKKDPELAEIPVVIISITNERSLGFNLGASAMLTKPVDRNELIEVLKRHLTPIAGTAAKDAPILIVEDDPATREIMTRAVEKLEFKAVALSNGREGMDWLADNEPPLAILLDLNMPELNGFGFLRHLRGDERWANIPVIVCTAQELSARERQILGKNAQLVIAKGQAAHVELSQAIRNITAQATRSLAGKVT
ncbi:response regulator [Starkeya sp. ORNL1]|uniref:response regulator n=1 Tax=Starkeya sp. ORNL1 TaxID=2709380 RepID=UPI0014648407|nr:response regulator [Starkeya sp. ORNL1]QJP15081.1 response regulator [Starkeya sp. ORNL1]